eukprot:1907072-Prymnesium_polylepis.1
MVSTVPPPTGPPAGLTESRAGCRNSVEGQLHVDRTLWTARSHTDHVGGVDGIDGHRVIAKEAPRVEQDAKSIQRESSKGVEAATVNSDGGASVHVATGRAQETDCGLIYFE